MSHLDDYTVGINQIESIKYNKLGGPLLEDPILKISQDDHKSVNSAAQTIVRMDALYQEDEQRAMLLKT